VTAQGHPAGKVQKRDRGRWVFHAELAARECGNLTLAEALELVCLYAEVEPAKFERAALRVCAVAAARADCAGCPRGTPGRKRTREEGSARASRSATELALDALRVSLLQFWEGLRPGSPSNARRPPQKLGRGKLAKPHQCRPSINLSFASAARKR
jgi:hypothetical protein